MGCGIPSTQEWFYPDMQKPQLNLRVLLTRLQREEPQSVAAISSRSGIPIEVVRCALADNFAHRTLPADQLEQFCQQLIVAFPKRLGDFANDTGEPLYIPKFLRED